MYQARTRGVSVTVEPAFSAERSAPEKGAWFWTYTIEIANADEETVQLLTRYWNIVDGNGQTFEGEGVVGEQPVLEPGTAFRYTSGVPLATPFGFMSGHYVMQRQGGGTFEAEVPAFSLDSPDGDRSIN